MNNEDNIKFNCGTFSTDGKQVVFENATAARIEEGPAFEGKAEDFNIASLPSKIRAELARVFDARLTPYAISIKEGNLDKQVAEK